VTVTEFTKTATGVLKTVTEYMYNEQHFPVAFV